MSHCKYLFLRIDLTVPCVQTGKAGRVRCTKKASSHLQSEPSVLVPSQLVTRLRRLANENAGQRLELLRRLIQLIDTEAGHAQLLSLIGKDVIIRSVRIMLSDPVVEVRARTYRLIRRLMRDLSDLQLLLACRIEFFIARYEELPEICGELTTLQQFLGT